MAVHDSRLDGHSGKPVSTLEGAHIKPHSAVWKPDSDRIFMTGEFEFELYSSSLLCLWAVPYYHGIPYNPSI